MDTMALGVCNEQIALRIYFEIGSKNTVTEIATGTITTRAIFTQNGITTLIIGQMARQKTRGSSTFKTSVAEVARLQG